MNNEPKPLNVLLVDDEKDFRLATSRALSKRGFAVITAVNGEEAIASVRSMRPDIVLLDLKMPGMSGIETLQKLRQIEKSLPVMILTGHGSFHDALSGINLEIVDFIQKPVDMDLLVAQVRRFLVWGKKERHRETSQC